MIDPTSDMRVCPWWFCRARVGEWCCDPRGYIRPAHWLRRAYNVVLRRWIRWSNAA